MLLRNMVQIHAAYNIYTTQTNSLCFRMLIKQKKTIDNSTYITYKIRMSTHCCHYIVKALDKYVNKQMLHMKNVCYNG